MMWYLIKYSYAGEEWTFDVKSSSEKEALDVFKQTDAYTSGDCRIMSISIMSANEARIAQKNYDRITKNRKSYEERLKELENEDEEFKKTAMYSRLVQFYKERMT